MLHFAMAAMATPLMVGHIFMPPTNPSTRVGLSGRISGFVDRKWARHHYGRWYREQLAKESHVPAVCSLCHTLEHWSPANISDLFDYNEFRFPLAGAHQAVECQSCHQSGVYAGLDQECLSCHQESGSRYESQACYSCHPQGKH